MEAGAGNQKTSAFLSGNQYAGISDCFLYRRNFKRTGAFGGENTGDWVDGDAEDR